MGGSVVSRKPPPDFMRPTIGLRAGRALRELLDLAEIVGDAAIPCRAVEDPRPWISEDSEETARAAELCESCPLLPECRSYGRAARELGGVFGGLTPAARLALYNEDPRRRPASATERNAS